MAVNKDAAKGADGVVGIRIIFNARDPGVAQEARVEDLPDESSQIGGIAIEMAINPSP